ncbi:MAG TPA: maleylpyruvate isomerase N-terminal domain-containing protein [Streptomyces sp.]|nr:maleylpyruvate isomerase N-terminal domain-containing protein [Streptomyces sp.]
MTIRDDYLAAAATAVELLREPAVAEAWGRPSALEDFSVGGLAAHLAGQIRHVVDAEPVSPGAPLSLLENYARAAWAGQGPEHEVNVAIRQAGEKAGSDGPAALAARAGEDLAQARARVASAPDGLVVHMAGRDLAFDDFLLTRLMEILVHADDLAASVQLPTPEFDESAGFAVTDLLSRLAVRRHGLTPVLRALARSERAPRTVSAF